MGTDNYAKPHLAKFRVEYVPGRGFVVVDPNGNWAANYYTQESHALTARDGAQKAWDAKHKRKQRPCLRCGTDFMSEGIHNRMCNRCRNCASNDESAPFSFGAIHGRKRA